MNGYPHGPGLGLMRAPCCVVALTATLLLPAYGHAADKKLKFRFTVGPGATITVVNRFGPVVVLPSPDNQVNVVAVTHSDNVSIEQSQSGNRVDLRARLLQRVSDSDARVEFEVKVPVDAAVTLRSADGPLRVEKLRGNITLQGESAEVRATDLTKAHLRVRTVSGPVILSNVANTYVDVTSVGGAVTLNHVTGPNVAVNTSSGAIRYEGDFGADGNYSLMNHSGNIDVLLPASASVDLTAHSVSGSVHNDFPFQPKPRASLASAPDNGLAGLANSGASSVRISSFTGTITVRKQ